MFSFKQGFKRARKKTGLSQEGFACKYHFSLPTVKKWEQGKAVPDFGTLCTLCDIFQCSMDYLVAENDLPSHDLQFIHDEIGLTLEGIVKLQKYGWKIENTLIYSQRLLWMGILSTFYIC